MHRSVCGVKSLLSFSDAWIRPRRNIRSGKCVMNQPHVPSHAAENIWLEQMDYDSFPSNSCCRVRNSGFVVLAAVGMKSTEIWDVMLHASCLLVFSISSTLMMEAVLSSVTSVKFCRITYRHLPDDVMSKATNICLEFKHNFYSQPYPCYCSPEWEFIKSEIRRLQQYIDFKLVCSLFNNAVSTSDLFISYEITSLCNEFCCPKPRS